MGLNISQVLGLANRLGLSHLPGQRLGMDVPTDQTGRDG